MLKLLAAPLLLFSVASAAADWSKRDVAALEAAIEASEGEGLNPSDYSLDDLRSASQADDPALSIMATQAALQLAHDYFEGAAPAKARRSWYIPRSPFDYTGWLDRALARGDVRGEFSRLLPDTAGYRALRHQLKRCAGPTCDTIRSNLDRWRWLPRDLGSAYLWVNVPSYELSYVRGGEVTSGHRVIVGKEALQTPSFVAAVTGVTANPWWNVPCSIVDESIGQLVRTNPTEAARRGYVSSVGADGKLVVRQKPGPTNALGRIKLEMPNPYSVFVHDTPSRSLFEQDARALSHGCIRTEAPDQLARQLLSPEQGRELEVSLKGWATRTYKLASPIPVYVVYFTADAGPSGLRTFPDIYARDKPLAAALSR